MNYYLVGNTHFDPVWLWTWDEAMASIRATFSSVLQSYAAADFVQKRNKVLLLFAPGKQAYQT